MLGRFPKYKLVRSFLILPIMHFSNFKIWKSSLENGTSLFSHYSCLILDAFCKFSFTFPVVFDGCAGLPFVPELLECLGETAISKARVATSSRERDSEQWWHWAWVECGSKRPSFTHKVKMKRGRKFENIEMKCETTF